MRRTGSDFHGVPGLPSRGEGPGLRENMQEFYNCTFPRVPLEDDLGLFSRKPDFGQKS